jgi:hypothetical protein
MSFGRVVVLEGKPKTPFHGVGVVTERSRSL